MWLFNKLSNFLNGVGISLGILAELARIIDLITCSEFKGSMLVVSALLLAGLTLNKLITTGTK